MASFSCLFLEESRRELGDEISCNNLRVLTSDVGDDLLSDSGKSKVWSDRLKVIEEELDDDESRGLAV